GAQPEVCLSCVVVPTMADARVAVLLQKGHQIAPERNVLARLELVVKGGACVDDRSGAGGPTFPLVARRWTVDEVGLATEDCCPCQESTRQPHCTHRARPAE